MALFIVHVKAHVQVCDRQVRGGFFWPLRQLEARAGKNIAKAGVFPFARVAEAVEVKVPHGQRLPLQPGIVRLHHRVGGAFDAAFHPQGAQQVPHQGGFARAQVAMQRHKSLAHARCAGQSLGQVLGGGLIGAHKVFYNGQVSLNSHQFITTQWVSDLQGWGLELGFSQIGVSDVDLSHAEPGLLAWLGQGNHGEMAYMASHGLKRARPAELVPGTLSVITARMDYLPRHTQADWQAQETQALHEPGTAVVSVYARGRDYHKVLRARLQKLADRISHSLGPLGYRVFTDSAPVLEAELATRSGLGWRGKHTLVLNREAGSMFFLGEIFVDVALPPTPPVSGHCGTCSACITACPTQAITGPYQLDARRCISYLTIEHAGPIPEALRSLMGNRIYGCDDCQTACPWNKYAQRSTLPDFDARAGLTHPQLLALMAWDETEFLKRTEGSAIRRIGHARWQRNIAVAMGNALRNAALPDNERQAITTALQRCLPSANDLVREHLQWALAQDAQSQTQAQHPQQG